MSDNSRHVARNDTMVPVISQQSYDANIDYVINEYMERLGTRLNILETELKYAWRALDLLSQEYIKMWERLEKLESLLYEQQSVISQLLEFYTSGGAPTYKTELETDISNVFDGRLGELEVIREILGNGIVEDGLEEGLDISRATINSGVIKELDYDNDNFEMHVPDEAFYKSLNQAYREDLGNLPSQTNQLGMIWEEHEDLEDKSDNKNGLKTINQLHSQDSEEVYSALDYKDYRGNSPCISDQDLAQLTRIDSIDHVAIEKLTELDRLSNILQQESNNIKQLQRKLLESPLKTRDEHSDNKLKPDFTNNQLKTNYTENENWTFSNNSRNQDEILMLAKSELSNSICNIPYSTRPSSRLSITDSVIETDNEVAEMFAGGLKTPTSPRRRQIEIVSCSAPFTTVTGRLAYSAAVQHVDSAAAAAVAAANSKNPFYCPDSNSLIAVSYETISSTTPNIFNIKSEKTPSSPTLSISSIRTRKDGYLPSNQKQSPSPPPPAPVDITEPTSLTNNIPQQDSSIFLNATDLTVGQSQERLSPKVHSPKSPKTSPKRTKSHSISDSGLSSMSGWSNLEKSPISPKNTTKLSSTTHFSDIKYHTTCPASPAAQNKLLVNQDDSNIQVSSSQGTLPGGHHLSAFKTVKSPCNLETSEGYGTFVPAPAPVSDINVSPRRKSKHKYNEDNFFGDFMYTSDQPAIYSVAGNNKDNYTSVYTSNSVDYISQTINYPDLIEPYENNENNLQQKQTTTTQLTDEITNRRKSLSRMYSTSNGSDGISGHEGYKTAMHRTMFPTGNITDALSYYPTSSRNVTDYTNSPSTWSGATSENQFNGNGKVKPHAYNRQESGEMFLVDGRNQMPIDPRLIQKQMYEGHSIDQCWNQRQEIPYLELDLKNRNAPGYVIQQQPQQQQQQPQQQPQQQQETSYTENKFNYEGSNIIKAQSGYITITNDTNDTKQEEKIRKMKRGNSIKSAMNSVSQWLPDLHITKRARSYSLPVSARNEDIEKTRSAHLKNARKKKKNAIVSTVSGILQKAKRKSQSQSLSDPEQSENEWISSRASSLMSEDERSDDSLFYDNQEQLFAKVPLLKQKIDEPQETIEDQLSVQYDQLKISPQRSDISIKSEPDSNPDAINEEETSGKSSGSGTSSIFATVGETRKSSSDKSDETIVSDAKMVVVVGGASMEFAVSRALGKYRQRQSSSLSDDQIFDEENNISNEEIKDDVIVEEKEKEKDREKLIEQKSLDSQSSSDIIKNVTVNGEGSPSNITFRGKFFPRHQQSLEIPFHKDEDDNRSTHSWRSTSRVSSRRQSTEDSIDSDDEWYCYELRKLEEMEKQSQVEIEVGETLKEEPIIEEFYEPYEEVKEKMSFVLRELRMKTKIIDGVLNEKERDLNTVQSAKRRENENEKRESIQLESAHLLFNKIRGLSTSEEIEDIPKSPISAKDEEHSSGETSGPDSPHHSNEEDIVDINEGFSRCHIVRKSKHDDDLSEDIDNIKKSVPDDSVVPNIEIESQIVPKSEDEPTKEGGPLGSKWKLLKALKERKAEEKSSQTKVTETTTEKEKVSMLGMMQKFYEIHVKT